MPVISTKSKQHFCLPVGWLFLGQHFQSLGRSLSSFSGSLRCARSDFFFYMYLESTSLSPFPSFLTYFCESFFKTSIDYQVTKGRNSGLTAHWIEFFTATTKVPEPFRSLQRLLSLCFPQTRSHCLWFQVFSPLVRHAVPFEFSCDSSFSF